MTETASSTSSIPTSPGTDEEGSGKAYLIGETKTLLLEQHLYPETDAEGKRIGFFDRGVREGTILAYLDVILNLDGDPVYDTDTDTLRKMLLGQALTEHMSG